MMMILGHYTTRLGLGTESCSLIPKKSVHNLVWTGPQDEVGWSIYADPRGWQHSGLDWAFGINPYTVTLIGAWVRLVVDKPWEKQ